MGYLPTYEFWGPSCVIIKEFWETVLVYPLIFSTSLCRARLPRPSGSLDAFTGSSGRPSQLCFYWSVLYESVPAKRFPGLGNHPVNPNSFPKRSKDILILWIKLVMPAHPVMQALSSSHSMSKEFPSDSISNIIICPEILDYDCWSSRTHIGDLSRRCDLLRHLKRGENGVIF